MKMRGMVGVMMPDGVYYNCKKKKPNSRWKLALKTWIEIRLRKKK